jgi:hypothetical protein
MSVVMVVFSICLPIDKYNLEKAAAKTQLQNDSLNHALDSLRTKQTPCPDTLFIFLPPMR